MSNRLDACHAALVLSSLRTCSNKFHARAERPGSSRRRYSIHTTVTTRARQGQGQGQGQECLADVSDECFSARRNELWRRARFLRFTTCSVTRRGGLSQTGHAILGVRTAGQASRLWSRHPVYMAVGAAAHHQDVSSIGPVCLLDASGRAEVRSRLPSYETIVGRPDAAREKTGNAKCQRS